MSYLPKGQFTYRYEIHIIPLIEKQVFGKKHSFKIKTYERFNKRNKVMKCLSWDDVDNKCKELIWSNKNSRIEWYFFRHWYTNYLKICSGYGK